MWRCGNHLSINRRVRFISTILFSACVAMKDPQREGAVVKPHGTSHDVLDCSCGLGRDCTELPLHGGPVELVTRVQTFVGGTRFFFPVGGWISSQGVFPKCP